MKRYSCSICKELLSKYKKNRKRYRYTPKDLFSWMIDWDTEDEVIEHIKKKHRKIYNQVMKHSH